jgi:NAD(P)-dependent dehydrogenase (short-subunit alcohol dehydrogenase family)
LILIKGEAELGAVSRDRLKRAPPYLANEIVEKSAMGYLAGKNAVVTGGSRGSGRGIVEAFAAEGVRVVAIARSNGPLEELRKTVKSEIETVVGDATHPILAARLLANVKPQILVLNAGARGHKPSNQISHLGNILPPVAKRP